MAHDAVPRAGRRLGDDLARCAAPAVPRLMRAITQANDPQGLFNRGVLSPSTPIPEDYPA